MSLFGLFHVALGLGAVAKDAISDSISDSINMRKAEEASREMYYINGRSPRATKTGKPAYMDYGHSKYDHVCVRDLRTREVVEDVTIKMNAQRQIKIKEEAKEKGEVFYRTTEFDTSIHHLGNVYVSDSIPGYFRPYYHKCETMYEEGELVRSDSWAPTTYKVKSPDGWQLGHKIYYDDGSIYSEDAITPYHNPLLEAKLKFGDITKEEYDAAIEKEKNYKGKKYYKRGERFE